MQGKCSKRNVKHLIMILIVVKLLGGIFLKRITIDVAKERNGIRISKIIKTI